MEKKYNVVNGTSYDARTSPEVVEVLERFRNEKERLRIHCGDSRTGKAWGDVDIGYLGRSSGPVHVPLVIHNRRSIGGPALLDHCIVKIEFSNKRKGGVVYKHPNYSE